MYALQACPCVQHLAWVRGHDYGPSVVIENSDMRSMLTNV